MQDCKEPDILIVTTTVGSAGDAQRLARELLQRRLAACVQIDAGVTSFYRWQGQLCEDAEWRLVIKTQAEHEGALQAFFAEQHPYEVPQFVAWTAAASNAYAAWVLAETS